MLCEMCASVRLIVYLVAHFIFYAVYKNTRNFGTKSDPPLAIPGIISISNLRVKQLMVAPLTAQISPKFLPQSKRKILLRPKNRPKKPL